MFVLKRNSVIITALVIMIAFAGYLNYIDHKNSANPDLASAGGAVESSLLLDDAQSQEFGVLRNTPSDEITGEALIDGENAIAMTYDEAAGVISEPGASADGKDSSANGEEDSADREPGAAVFVNSTSDSSFFVQAKLEREQTRSKDKETLQQLINNTNLEKEQRDEYVNAILEIQKKTEKETATEAMIEAKGFTEAYVRIDDKNVDVVVSKAVLSDVEIAQIEDIVKRKTGLSVENITISPNKS